MRRFTLTTVALALLAPAPARAGLVLGAATGLSRTGGSVAAGEAMKDAASWMIPVQLEAGWKLASRLTLVASFDMSFGMVSGTYDASCDASGDDCSANQSRVGARARWSFLPERPLDPWVGAGVAWEVLGMERISGTAGRNTNVQGTGWEIAAGMDWWFARRFAVSPYLSLSFGRYGERKDVSAFGEWQPIAETRVHTALTIGARLWWDLGGTSRSAARAEPPAAPAG